MRTSISLPEYLDIAHRDMPAFVSRYDVMDRKSYLLAIERWETEGGAIRSIDDRMAVRELGEDRARRTAVM